jgi:hypothetical protein
MTGREQANFLFVFNVESEPEPVAELLPAGEDPALAARHYRGGMAGQHLVVADLLIRGFDASVHDGIDADVIGTVHGLRQFQVKSTEAVGTSFGRTNGGTKGRNGRTLDSYKGKGIDALAFVLLPRRLVYYCHIAAIATRSLVLADSCWTRQASDHSFAELHRRFRGEGL